MLGQKSLKKIVGFLIDLKTSKCSFEISKLSDLYQRNSIIELTINIGMASEYKG